MVEWFWVSDRSPKRQLLKSSKIIQISVHDDLILGGRHFRSLRQATTLRAVE